MYPNHKHIYSQLILASDKTEKRSIVHKIQPLKKQFKSILYIYIYNYWCYRLIEVYPEKNNVVLAL